MRPTKTGFTIIEIIVVIIILGVLVAMGVPAYFSWIIRSESAEAMVSISSIRAQLIPCLRAHQGDEAACFPQGASCSSVYMWLLPDGTWQQGPANRCYNWANPGSPNFSYQVLNSGIFRNFGGEWEFDLDTQSWTINAFKGAPAEQNLITISGNGNDTRSLCGGVGLFQGVC